MLATWAARRLRLAVVLFCVFFSSRRRHTRLQGDWSSDVCSSDLEPAVLEMDRFFRYVNDTALARPNLSVIVDDARSALQIDPTQYDVVVSEPSNPWLEIGRASCRERV